MNTFKVFCDDVLGGTSKLEWGDPAMGAAFGTFYPTEAYKAIEQERIENHGDQSDLNLNFRTPPDEKIICVGVAILDFADKPSGECASLEVQCTSLEVLGILEPQYDDLFPEHVAEYKRQFSRGHD